MAIKTGTVKETGGIDGGTSLSRETGLISPGQRDKVSVTKPIFGPGPKAKYEI